LIEKLKFNNEKIKEMFAILEFCKRFFEEEEEERVVDIRDLYQ